MASLSSKSAKRFRVNFQTKKRMMPTAAMPPATDSPMMEPVLRPPLLELLEPSVWEGGGLDIVGAVVT